MILGLLMLFCAVVVPILGAHAMLTDPNYVFLLGKVFPYQVYVSIFFISLLYCVVCFTMYKFTPQERFNEYTMEHVAAVFGALLGLVFIVLTLPATQGMHVTAGYLTAGCSTTVPEVMALTDYSNVLRNIKSTQNCTDKTSVEECDGWAENKYTAYLRSLEKDFQCGLMCSSPVASLIQMEEKHHGHHHDHHHRGHHTELAVKNVKRAHHRHHHTELAVNSVEVARDGPVTPMPLLFSEGTTTMPCFPMIATRLGVLSWNANDLIFWEGFSLIMCSVFASIASCMGTCCYVQHTRVKM